MLGVALATEMIVLSAPHATGAPAAARQDSLRGEIRRAEAVLARDPRDVDAVLRAANAEAWLGRHEDAERRLRRAIALLPLVPRLRGDLAALCTARLDLAGARSALLEGLAAMPDQPELLITLGHVEAARMRETAAMTAFARALEVAEDPRIRAAAHLGLSGALQRSGQRDKAAFHDSAAYALVPGLESYLLLRERQRIWPAPGESDWMSTHPDPDRRIREAKRRANALTAGDSTRKNGRPHDER